MTVAQETGELRNPGHPGNEEFDTVTYGSPPLPYSALLAQFAIYNTPDPAYVTGRINVSAFANLGAAPVAVSQHERAAQWTCLHSPRKRPFPARCFRARQSQSTRKLDARIPVSVPIVGVAWDHRGND